MFVYRACLIFLLYSLFCLTACSSSQFIPGEVHAYYPEREQNCELKYFTEFPNDKFTYDLIGTCIGTGRKGIINNDYENAHKMIERCACMNGANAIVLVDSWVKGEYKRNYVPGPQGQLLYAGNTYWQQAVDIKAYAIYITGQLETPSSGLTE